MSVTVVKIGPEASAGSTFIRFKIKGIVPPRDSIIMTTGLISKKEDIEEVDELSFTDWEELDNEIEEMREKERVEM